MAVPGLIPAHHVANCRHETLDVNRLGDVGVEAAGQGRRLSWSLVKALTAMAGTGS